jgi:hypothetical protein
MKRGLKADPGPGSWIPSLDVSMKRGLKGISSRFPSLLQDVSLDEKRIERRLSKNVMKN